MAGNWTAADIPDQAGRTAVVTGANSGLGVVASRELARAGARVVMACRNVEKGEQAAGTIRDEVPARDVQVVGLDLADLGSVREFAERMPDRVDLLINNAGVMAPPRRLTKDGFESQFGTNHLGHYALTGQLLARLLAAPAPRVVTVSSGAHRIGTIKFDDLQRERHYNNWLAYGPSKLANLMFCFELQKRASAAQSASMPLLGRRRVGNLSSAISQRPVAANDRCAPARLTKNGCQPSPAGAGWRDLLRRHGLDIGAPDLAAELARELTGPPRDGYDENRFTPGFQQLC